MSFGLSPSGFVPMRFEDVKSALEASFKSEFGNSVNLDASTPEGQLIALLAAREASLWELLEAIYNSRSPNSAAGQDLDSAASINNVTRLSAIPSSFTSAAGNMPVVVGTPGTIIPIGFQAHVDGNADAAFVTEQQFTVGGGGTVSVEMFCIAVAASGLIGGPVAAPAGSLTEIDTPVAGITAISNAQDATLGRDVETDAELRIRRKQSLSTAGASTLDAIFTVLSQVVDVLSCHVYENTGDVVNGDGLPPKSIEAVVQGGTDSAIAAALWAAKPAGIETFGTTSQVVTDIQGNNQTVNFSRPEQVELYIAAIVTPNTNPAEGPLYPADGNDQVAAALLAFGNEQEVGVDVFPVRFMAAILSVQGVNAVDLYIDSIPVPVNQAPITIGTRQLASFDSSRIEVTNP